MSVSARFFTALGGHLTERLAINVVRIWDDYFPEAPGSPVTFAYSNGRVENGSVSTPHLSADGPWCEVSIIL